jgi:hypothetical protein
VLPNLKGNAIYKHNAMDFTNRLVFAPSKHVATKAYAIIQSFLMLLFSQNTEQRFSI